VARRSRAEREGTEDEHGLLDAQLLAPLAALGEEAEHLDGAGGADGGEVGERGRGALAHGTAAVLRQLAELVEGRGRLAALPRAAAAEPHQLRDGRGVRADAAFVTSTVARLVCAVAASRHEPDARVVAVQGEEKERPSRHHRGPPLPASQERGKEQ